MNGYSILTKPVRSFTNEGLAAFSDWLARAEASEQKRWTSEPPPTHLLFDERYATELGYGDPIKQRRFDRKYDMGLEVCRAVEKDNFRRLMPNANAWAWLALFFHESTMPTKKGKWFTGHRSRHLVQTIANRKQDQSHRHLVKGAATNVSRFGRYAVVLMAGCDEMSKTEEQIMSRRVDPPFAFLSEVIQAIYKLHWDVDADDLKKGARGEGNGSIMHLNDLLAQFDFTYDVSHLSADRLIGLLPPAFQRFMSQGDGATSRRKRIRSGGAEFATA